MNRLFFLTLAAKSLLNRRLTAALTVLSIALAVTLFLGVEKIRMGAKESFDNTISGTDLIVGARSGSLNLLLYSVFRLGDPTNNVTWESYRAFAERPDVAWTVPLSLGDSHKGYRVIGTTPAYFEHYKYGRRQDLTFADGQPFEKLFETVLGAEVAAKLGYRIGDEITLAHGIGSTSFANHEDKPFRVVGILAPTGTPVDKSVHVSLEAIEAIHLGWQSGARTPLAKMFTKERVEAMKLQPDQITAFLVGLTSRAAALRYQRDVMTYRREPLQAVIPGVALAQLWQVVGVAETALTAIAAFVVFTGLLGMLTAILTSLNERRREMAILRSAGARPWMVFALLMSEAALLAFCGALLGIAAVYLGFAAGAPFIEAQLGIFVGGLYPGLYDLLVLGAVTGAALVLGAVPAFRAYRNSLADGLTIRL